MPGRLPLTADAVQRTVDLAVPAVRNLWITQSYADLARRLLDVLETDQTWCTFAIWASNTAGTSIRGEELPRRVSELLLGADMHVDAIARGANDRTSLWRRLGVVRELQHSHIEHLVARAVDQVSEYIAGGNALVYGELAPLFVRFLDSLAGGDTPTPDDVDHWLDGIAIPSASEQPLVRAAFEQYALAAACTDPARRAQHVLAANIAAVLHEQQRLQTDIVRALDAGVVDVGDDLCGLISRLVPTRLCRWLVGGVRAHIAADVERLWQHVATGLMMTLSLPGQTLHLDRDVPPLPDGELFPVALRAIDLDALTKLIAEWDPTGGSGHGSGARDWADLHQRMGYIVNLFRSRQQALTLTVPPFTDVELAFMIRNEVPPSI